jgi:hypothetical protein
MDSKACFKCHTTQPLGEFYKHSEMADGHLNKCKDCTRADVFSNRTAKLDYYRAYDRVRYAHHGYRGTASDEAQRRGSRAYRARHPDRRRAHLAVQCAVRRGDIKPPKACSGCRRKGIKLHAHHEDYSKPLKVTWLCHKCHCETHRRYDVRDDLAVLARGPMGRP